MFSLSHHGYNLSFSCSFVRVALGFLLFLLLDYTKCQPEQSFLPAFVVDANPEVPERGISGTIYTIVVKTNVTVGVRDEVVRISMGTAFEDSISPIRPFIDVPISPLNNTFRLQVLLLKPSTNASFPLVLSTNSTRYGFQNQQWTFPVYFTILRNCGAVRFTTCPNGITNSRFSATFTRRDPAFPTLFNLFIVNDKGFDVMFSKDQDCPNGSKGRFTAGINASIIQKRLTYEISPTFAGSPDVKLNFEFATPRFLSQNPVLNCSDVSIIVSDAFDLNPSKYSSSACKVTLGSVSEVCKESTFKPWMWAAIAISIVYLIILAIFGYTLLTLLVVCGFGVSKINGANRGTSNVQLNSLHGSGNAVNNNGSGAPKNYSNSNYSDYNPTSNAGNYGGGNNRAYNSSSASNSAYNSNYNQNYNNQSSYNQRSYNQSSNNPSSYNQSNYNPNSYNQSSNNPSSYNQSNYNPNSYNQNYNRR